MKQIRNTNVFAKTIVALFLVSAIIIPSTATFVSAENSDEPLNAVYVSKNGSDSGSGTLESPLATIAGARDFIRNNRSSLEGGVTVYIEEGDYYQDETLTFTEEDSGSEDFPIVYKAYNNGSVSIDGGTTLKTENFQKPADDDPYASRIKDSAARENVIMYDLKADGIDYERDSFALSYGGVRGTLARYPNEQFILGFNYSDSETGTTSDYDSSTHTFYDKEHVVKTWQSVEGVQIKGNFEIDWSSSPATDLVSYDASTNRVKVGNVSINGISGRYYYSNVIEEIDMVGEYYVDKDNGILYFYAPENYRDIKISVPKAMTYLVSFEGADNITFDGITIENCTYTNYTNKYNGGTLVNIQADDITIQNGMIRCGHQAVYSDGYRTNVFNNEIYHIGATAISLYGGDLTYLLPSNTVVSNNIIHDFGDIERVYNGAFYAEGVGFVISHNEIYNSPHTALQNLATSLIVEYNYFHDLCYEGGDAGAIYDGTWRGNGNTFSNNIIANISNPTSPYYNPNGYYCDDGGGGKTFVSNLLINIDGDAIAIGGGPANIIRDNIIVNSSFSYDQRAYYPGTGPNAGWTLTGKFGVSPSDYGLNWGWMINGVGSYATEAWAIQFPWTMLLKTTNVVDLDDNFVPYAFSNTTIRNNIICRSGTMSFQSNVERLANIRDNLTGYLTDYIFNDFAAGDYTVSSDARVYHDLPGLRPCDVSKVGIQPVE